PASWVWETHELARDMAYPLAEQANGWNAIYRRDAMPALETQLKKAAVRLAVRLNMVAAINAPAGAGHTASPSLLDY
ncbi:MAG: S1/P1 nuclease, partial [Natronospirillum sp.]